MFYETFSMKFYACWGHAYKCVFIRFICCIYPAKLIDSFYSPPFPPPSHLSPVAFSWTFSNCFLQKKFNISSFCFFSWIYVIETMIIITKAANKNKCLKITIRSPREYGNMSIFWALWKRLPWNSSLKILIYVHKTKPGERPRKILIEGGGVGVGCHKRSEGVLCGGGRNLENYE